MDTSNKADEFKSLRDIYQHTVNEHALTTVSMSRLLVPTASQRFIKDRFKTELKEEKIKECLEAITNERSVHMVSAFLLGYSIRDQLTFDTRSWRRLPRDKSPRGSFDLFWSWICLFHDIAYVYENDSAKYKDCQQVKELIEFLNLEYNLLDVSDNVDLINKYYAYRNQPGEHQTLDHGITGAVLLYNALRILGKNNDVYSKIKEHIAFYARISDTVALHNMWRSTEKTLDDYMAYELYELIPDTDKHHIIYYRDNQMLFLLALVDTIDPIKAFSTGSNPKVKVYDILKEYRVKFTNYSKKKELIIKYDSPYFEEYSKKMSNPESGLQSWLGVTVQPIATRQELKITIDIETSLKS